MPDNPLQPIEALDPRLMKMMQDTRDLALGEGALPRKYKFLIAMCLDAADGASDGVASLARAAMRAGATKEEVGEALRVAQYICGAGAIYTAAKGIKETL